ncbi:MAG TPA: hypothetical protein VG433_06645 [Pirellulales bacterium]|nr:hypothetical protein [Pirellulales bacterium]HWC89311.1 hypothetical protein [Pirellulales bacterium]
MSAHKRIHLFLEYSLYEEVRQHLLEKGTVNFDRPLATWAVEGDRALPLTLMRFPLRDLLEMSFDQLCSLQGIGRKKINSLVSLLHRAAGEEASGAADSVDRSAIASAQPISEANDLAMAADAVSEAMWREWQETIRRHRLERLTLGQSVASLRELPRILWTSPLANYLELSLVEVQQLPRHGHTRLHAIMDVFKRLHAALTPLENTLTASFQPQSISRVEGWLAEKHMIPSVSEIRQQLVLPLIEQISIDEGPELADAVRSRLLENREQPAERTGRRLPVSSFYRRKVAAIISARWPKGEHVFQARLASWNAHDVNEATLALLISARDWFFGARYGRSSHPAEPMRNAPPKSELLEYAARSVSRAREQRQASHQALRGPSTRAEEASAARLVIGLARNIEPTDSSLPLLGLC